MWLSILRPDMTKVDHATDADKNNYYLISGEGYPSLLNHLENAIEEVNAIDKYDYLVLCLDAEESTIEKRKKEIQQHLDAKEMKLAKAKLIIIVQNPCFETWFLGNRKIFKRTPQSQLLNEYIAFYDVRQNDPEEMPCHNENTRAQFHHSYLCEIFKERGLTYSKQKPGNVGEATFLNELISRNAETEHISSFKEFIEFIEQEVSHS